MTFSSRFRYRKAAAVHKQFVSDLEHATLSNCSPCNLQRALNGSTLRVPSGTALAVSLPSQSTVQTAHTLYTTGDRLLTPSNLLHPEHCPDGLCSSVTAVAALLDTRLLPAGPAPPPNFMLLRSQANRAHSRRKRHHHI